MNRHKKRIIFILGNLIIIPILLYLHFCIFAGNCYSPAELEVTFPSGKNSISGVLTLPAKNDVSPAIVLLHGSDRGTEENYKEYADELVKAGYAVLRYDSPGKGRSTGNTFGETFEQRVEEALNAIGFLASRQEIDTKHIGLWGISQGGWICQMAAAQSNKVAFIIPVSGPGVAVPEQEIYRVGAETRNAGFSETEIKKAVLIRRLLLDAVLTVQRYEQVNTKEIKELGNGPWNGLHTLTYKKKNFAPQVQLNSLIQILKVINKESWSVYIGSHQILPMLESLPPEAFPEVKKGIETSLLMNPSKYLEKIKVPTLALFGEKDMSVPVDKSIRIYKTAFEKNKNKALTIKTFPDADHTIMVNDLVHPDFYPTMVSWLITLKSKNQ